MMCGETWDTNVAIIVPPNTIPQAVIVWTAELDLLYSGVSLIIEDFVKRRFRPDHAIQNDRRSHASSANNARVK